MKPEDLISEDKKLQEEKEIAFAKLPKRFYIGFEKGISKSDLEATKILAMNYVKDNFSSRRNSYIKIEKVKNNKNLPDGYIYEVQEEGEKVSYTKEILNKIDEQDYILVKTKENIVQIEKNLENLSCYYLTKNVEIEEESLFKPSEIEKTNENKLKPVFKDGYVMFSIGAILFSLSVLSLFFALLLKFVLLNDAEDYQPNVNYDLYPVTKIKSLESSVNSKIRSIMYKDNNWYIQRELRDEDGNLKVPEPQIIVRESEIIKNLKEEINEK